MQGGSVKSACTPCAGQTNPTRILQAKCGAGLCETCQPALPPLGLDHP